VTRRTATLPIILLVGTLASCKSCEDPPGEGKNAGAGSSEDGAPPTPEPPIEAAAPEDAASAIVLPPDEDAGASACKLTYGPAEQPFRGPAAMVMTPTELLLVANDAGKPRTFSVALNAKTPPPPSSFVGMRWPPCEVAGRFVYCQGPGGPIMRTTLGGKDTRTVVSESKSGTRIAAAVLGDGTHSVVAFLDVRQTTEGPMLQAFIALDDQEPVRLSEDGAGATTLRIAQRGAGAVAAYLDTRTAMVPVHAREITLVGNDLKLGADAVAFVGGAPERGVDFTLGGANGSLFIVVPMPRDTLEFGMAAIPIERPPRDDVHATWSLYPNGIDPAPIGASMDGWVARVRPKEKMPGAHRVLELGRLDDNGAFRSLGLVSEGKAITDVDLVADAQGGVWILYGDAKATWLERRICP
jgi:hypothetical protein